MHFSTTQLAPAEREAAYRDALKSYFAFVSPDVSVRVDTHGDTAFSASLEPLTIGQLVGGIHECNAPHVLHLPRTDLSGMDLYLLCEGDVSLFTADRTIHLRPGEMMLWPYGPEWEARSSHFRMIALGLPPSIADRQYEALRTLAGSPISTNGLLGGCVAALIRKAAEYRGPSNFEEATALQDTLLHGVTALALTQSGSGISPSCAEREAQLQRLKALTLKSLEQADLNPAMLAARAGISTRTLHRLFATSGTSFADWLRERRLERCWDELTRRGTSRRRSISGVALASGFGDLSTFNRAFRARFGITPRAAQAQIRRPEEAVAR